MSPCFWSEWDGRGLSDAVAWTIGWTENEDEATKEVRRLGVMLRAIRLEQGWIGTVGEDTIYDACTEDGECLDTPGIYVDDGSVTRATFAYVMVQ